MSRDWADICGGVILAAIGLGAAAWSALHLDFGSLRAMGPGFFPTVLGIGLALLGLAVALPAWGRAGEPVQIRWGDAAAVIGAIAIFGLGMSRLGVLLACFIAVLVASIPAPHGGWRWRIALAGAITALTWLVFVIGLQMSLPVFPRLQ